MQLHCEFVYMAGRSKIPQMFLVVWGRGEKCALSSSFHPLPPTILPFPCVCEMSPSFTFTATWNNIWWVFFITSVHLPFPPLSPMVVISQRPSAHADLCTKKAPMWAECHCWVGKFSWPNWNALSRDRWRGRQKRIKRTEFHWELELGITFDHVTTVQNDLFFSWCSYCHPCI